MIAERRLGKSTLARHGKLKAQLKKLEVVATRRLQARHLREYQERFTAIDELLYAYSRETDADEQKNILRTLEEIVADKSIDLPKQDIDSWDEELASRDRGYLALRKRDERRVGAFLTKYFSLRAKAELRTQADVAKKAGLSRTHVAALEAGNHLPQQQTLQKLAKAFGVDVTDLM